MNIALIRDLALAAMLVFGLLLMEGKIAGIAVRLKRLQSAERGYAFNQTRQAFLASDLRIASSHLSRLRGLMFTSAENFGFGQGLWIVPSHGVHTMFMRFPIDVVYLNSQNVVVHIEESVKPWRMAPLVMESATILELPAHTIWNTSTAVGDQVENAFGKRAGTAA